MHIFYHCISPPIRVDPKKKQIKPMTKKCARAHKICYMLHLRAITSSASNLFPIVTNLTKKHTQDIKKQEAPIEQPRRLSLRRPSYKQVELIQNESFMDVQLKPMTKDKVSPQTAQQSESSLTKVTTALCRRQQKHAVSYSLTQILSLFLSLTLLVSLSLTILPVVVLFFFLSIYFTISSLYHIILLRCVVIDISMD